jgi:hypothetical protein
MHEQPALGDRLPANASTWQNARLANRLGPLTLKAEFGCVVKDEYLSFGSRQA